MASKLDNLSKNRVAVKILKIVSSRKKGYSADEAAKKAKMPPAAVKKILEKATSLKILDKVKKTYISNPSTELFFFLSAQVEKNGKQRKVLEEKSKKLQRNLRKQISSLRKKSQNYAEKKSLKKMVTRQEARKIEKAVAQAAEDNEAKAQMAMMDIGRIEGDLVRMSGVDLAVEKINKGLKDFVKQKDLDYIDSNQRNLEDLIFSNQSELESLKKLEAAKREDKRIDEVVSRVLSTINEVAVRVSSIEKDVENTIQERSAVELIKEIESMKDRQTLLINRMKMFEQLDLMPLIKAVDELSHSVKKSKHAENVAIEFDRFRRDLIPSMRRAVSSLEDDIEVTKKHMESIHQVNANKLQVMQPYIHKTKEDIEHVKGSISDLTDSFKELREDLRRGVVVIE